MSHQGADVRGDAATCVRCGRAGAFNRAVVHRRVDAPVGALCADCEAAAFGVALRDARWRRDEGCTVCSRDDVYALPRHDLLIEPSAADEAPTVEYALTRDTVGLCREHLSALGGEAPADAPPAPSP